MAKNLELQKALNRGDAKTFSAIKKESIMLGSLRQTVDYDYQAINEFFESRPELYEMLDAMIISVRGPIMATVDVISNECSTFRYMMWRTMYDYTETSLLLLLRTKIDEGYALLRMAAELARDIARIAESQSNFEMWKSKASIHSSKEYKMAFRFNKNDAHEKHIYRLYNLASKYGVHSHQTRDAHLSHLGIVEGKYIKVNVTQRSMLDALTLWLFSFFPLHVVAASTFSTEFSKLQSDPLKHILQMELAVLPFIQDFKSNVKLNYAKNP